jgi:nucleotide-binding universal stress UspA family protein
VFRHILVPVDDSPCSENAARHAQNLSRLLGCRLTFLHVLSEGETSSKHRAAADRLLERMSSGARFAPTLRTVNEDGKSIPERILEVAREIDADLIVIGTHGRQGIERLLLGSVAQAVASTAEIPIQIIPSRVQSSRQFADRWRRVVSSPEPE